MMLTQKGNSKWRNINLAEMVSLPFFSDEGSSKKFLFFLSCNLGVTLGII